MLMVIAPSKTQDKTQVSWQKATEPALLDQAADLIAILKDYSIPELGTLMKMSDSLAEQTYARIHSFSTPFSAENASQALSTFQGDVYSRITCERYNAEDQDYLQRHLRILSGLYGVLRPMDWMQKYRLEMGCKLENPRGKNLYEFWGDLVTEEVNRELTDHDEQVVVNLASAEYSRVLKKKILKGSILQVDFKEQKGDTCKVVAIHAKRARGLMVDFAVRNRVKTVEELKGFQEDGYNFQPGLSKTDHFCFTRQV